MYNSIGPLYIGFEFSDIVVSKGYYLLIEVKSYSTRYEKALSNPYGLNQTFQKKYLKGQFQTDEDEENRMQVSKYTEPLPFNDGASKTTFVILNDTDRNITVNAMNFGYNGCDLDSSYYRYWFKIDYVHWELVSAPEYEKRVEESSADKVADAIDQQTEKQKGFFATLLDGITSGLNKLLDGILDGIKSLFVPGDVTDPDTGNKVSYFTAYFNEWNDWLDEHLGVLYFPFKILFDVLDKILTFSPSDNPTITFPGLTIMGQKLLDPIEYNMATYPIPWLETAHTLYLSAVDAIVGFWLVRLAYKKLNEIMGGGSD